MECLRKTEDGVFLSVRVVPRASKNSIQGLYGDALKVRITAPPVEGKANAALVSYLSKELNLPRAQVHIKSGETGRNKTVHLLGVDLNTIESELKKWTI
jgi:uncharacterized protein (TIGR00251 family)